MCSRDGARNLGTCFDDYNSISRILGFCVAGWVGVVRVCGL